jgi:hypothetical protein
MTKYLNMFPHVPIPAVQPDFALPVKDAKNSLNARVLKEMVGIRQKMSEGVLDGSPEYLQLLFLLMNKMDNERTRFSTTQVVNFAWETADGKEHVSDCWRFELIMAGYCAAAHTITKTLKDGTWDEIKDAYYKAYNVVRYVCKENIQSWTLRDEYQLPFECTLKGCELYCALIAVQLQLLGIEKRSEAGWKSDDLPIKMSKWVYEEMHAIRRQVAARIADRSGLHLQSIKDTLDDIQLQALCLVFYHSAQKLLKQNKSITDNNPNGYASAHRLLEYALALVEQKKEDKRPAVALLMKDMSEEVKRTIESDLSVSMTVKVVDEQMNRGKHGIWFLVPGVQSVFFANVASASSGLNKFVVPAEKGALMFK